MRVRGWLLGALCLLVSLAFACTQQSQVSSHDDSALESPQAGDQAAADDQVLTGQLRTVDPDKKTLIVAFEDDLYEFAYTDSTEVVGGGTATVQGLTGDTGNEITVHYRKSPLTSSKTAIKIELQ